MKATLACTLVLLLAGCGNSLNLIDVGGPDPVASPSPTPTPSPSPSPAAAAACRPADTVRVGFFGFDCPPGFTPPSNGAGVLPLACTGAATATPKVGGQDQPGPDHERVVPTWTVEEGAGFVVLQSLDGNPFNRRIVPLAATPAGVQVTVAVEVCGVRSSPGLTFRVAP